MRRFARFAPLLSVAAALVPVLPAAARQKPTVEQFLSPAHPLDPAPAGKVDRPRSLLSRQRLSNRMAGEFVADIFARSVAPPALDAWKRRAGESEVL